jgi:predicted MPP superfamily phosphohydrolase
MSLFFILQLAAPLMQLTGRRGFTPSRSMEVLQWYSSVALGTLSTMTVTAIGLELLLNITEWVLPQNLAVSTDLVWLAVFALSSLFTIIIGVAQASMGPCVREVVVNLERLPKTFDGFRIVQISDLHVSSLIGRRYTKRVVDMANNLNADIVALTGDFVDGSVEMLRYRTDPLATLKSNYGRFFVTGNHEYYHNALEWIGEHRRHGTTVLLNEHKLIKRGDSSLAVVGTIDRAGKYFLSDHKEDIPTAIAGIPPETVKVLLAHHPNCYDEAASLGVDLQLSGHTHGGQFFPWQFVVKLVHKYSRGLYKHKGMHIYVNPGTGFWGPPIRSTVPAEITLLILKSA